MKWKDVPPGRRRAILWVGGGLFCAAVVAAVVLLAVFLRPGSFHLDVDSGTCTETPKQDADKQKKPAVSFRSKQHCVDSSFQVSMGKCTSAAGRKFPDFLFPTIEACEAWHRNPTFAIKDGACVAHPTGKFETFERCVLASFALSDGSCKHPASAAVPAGVGLHASESECVAAATVFDGDKCVHATAQTPNERLYGSIDACEFAHKWGFDATSKDCKRSRTGKHNSYDLCLAQHVSFTDGVCTKPAKAPPLYPSMEACRTDHPMWGVVKSSKKCEASNSSGTHASEQKCMENAFRLDAGGNCVKGSSVNADLYADNTCGLTSKDWMVDPAEHRCRNVGVGKGTAPTEAKCQEDAFSWSGFECRKYKFGDTWLYGSEPECKDANEEREARTWNYSAATKQCVPAVAAGTFKTARQCRAKQFAVAENTGRCLPASYLSVDNHHLYASRAECETAAAAQPPALANVYVAARDECVKVAAAAVDGRPACGATADQGSRIRVVAETRKPGHRVLYLVNRTSQDIWVGITRSKTGPKGQGKQYNKSPFDDALTGFRLAPASYRAVHIPDDFSGRVWPRTNCTVADDQVHMTCATGDCKGMMQCGQISGNPPASLAEFTFDAAVDWFDLSNVDGYNVGQRLTLLDPGRVTPVAGTTPTQCVVDTAARSVPPELANEDVNPGAVTSLCTVVESQDGRIRVPTAARLALDEHARNLVCCRCHAKEDVDCVEPTCEFGCSPNNTVICGGANQPACLPTACDADTPRPPFRTCNGTDKVWERGGQCFVQQWPDASTGMQYRNVIKGHCGSQSYTWQYDDDDALRKHVHASGDGPDYLLEYIDQGFPSDIDLQLAESLRDKTFEYDPMQLKCRPQATPTAQAKASLDCAVESPTSNVDVLTSAAGKTFACDFDTGMVKEQPSGGSSFAEARSGCYKRRYDCVDGACQEVWDPLELRNSTTRLECAAMCPIAAAADKTKRYRCDPSTARCEPVEDNNDPEGLPILDCLKGCMRHRPDRCLVKATLDSKVARFDGDDRFSVHISKLQDVPGACTCTEANDGTFTACGGNLKTGTGFCLPTPVEGQTHCRVPSVLNADGTHCYDTPLVGLPCCPGCA